MNSLDWNVEVVVEGDGPPQHRLVHNVFTNIGREWLSEIIRFESYGIHYPAEGEDTFINSPRLRWMGVGAGAQPNTPDVRYLTAGIPISTSPDVYLKSIGVPQYTTSFSPRFEVAFSGTDFSWAGSPITVSEAAIVVGRYDGSPDVDVSLPDNLAAFYVSFPPVTKSAAQTLWIRWELRF